MIGGKVVGRLEPSGTAGAIGGNIVGRPDPVPPRPPGTDSELGDDVRVALPGLEDLGVGLADEGATGLGGMSGVLEGPGTV
jgi:hypothetical protein